MCSTGTSGGWGVGAVCGEKEKKEPKENPNDESIARLTWNTAYSSG